MAWDKDEILIILRDPDTGELDTTLRTVEVYPTTSDYPANKVTCNQLSNLSTYKPASDLDENTHYWIRVVRGVVVTETKLPAKNSEPNIGANPG